MNILEIIAKKRDGKVLSKEEIYYFVEKYTKGDITDYQAAALVMAIYINGMNYQETTDLTLAMAESGEVLDLSDLGNVVDKHSTGGIGDKITLILMPVVAALGVPVAKMSGRGLGFTGGTIDKLESIPGYNTGITIEEFRNNVKKIGISIMGQTLNLAPADKKLYALRDTISCVGSIPLIASSVMSKKIAAGTDKIVLEVTVGSGAFMKNIEDAKLLAETMINIGKLAKKETICVITNMNEPIGYSIGNSLEVKEAVEALNGNMQDDVREIVLTIGSTILQLAGKGDDFEKNKESIMEVISNGRALEKFRELVINQGGDVSFIDNIDKFENAKFVIPVESTKSGYVKAIKNEKIGLISCELGAGRITKESSINYKVGITISKKIGDRVNNGEIIGYIHADDYDIATSAVEELKNCYEICNEFVEKEKYILGILR